MRSNPSCPLYDNPARKQIDQLMYNGATPKQVMDLLRHQLNKAQVEFSRWDMEYQRKRDDETLRDTDIADRNRMLDAIKEREDSAQITVEELETHYKHASFKPNQAFKQPELDDGDILENVNFSQLQPHTMIGEGVSGLVFKSCNLVNCDVPEDATVEKCNNCQKSFCSHLHPEWKFEQECERVCEHVSKHVPELVIGGVVVARDIVDYEDKVVK